MSLNTAPQVEPFCGSALDRFRDHVGKFLRADLNVARAISEPFMGRAVRSFLERDEAGLELVAADLRRTGIRARWNAELNGARSTALARWITPHIEGPTLDLLCGTGGIGDALRTRGVVVTLSEREAGHIAYQRQHRCRFISMQRLETLHKAPFYGTVLLCTVLHHEEDADGLLAFAARLAQRRLIVIENCIEAAYPAEYQLLVDIFFNRCLNPNQLSSPGHHRSAADWARAASAYGDLSLVERHQQVPGIPLTHHMIVVDILRRTVTSKTSVHPRGPSTASGERVHDAARARATHRSCIEAQRRHPGTVPGNREFRSGAPTVRQGHRLPGQDAERVSKFRVSGEACAARATT